LKCESLQFIEAAAAEDDVGFSILSARFYEASLFNFLELHLPFSDAL